MITAAEAREQAGYQYTKEDIILSQIEKNILLAVKGSRLRCLCDLNKHYTF